MKFTYSLKYENYLSIMTKFESRKLFTKLRISAHDLLIECGRYCQPILYQLRTDYVQAARSLMMKYILLWPALLKMDSLDPEWMYEWFILPHNIIHHIQYGQYSFLLYG